MCRCGWAPTPSGGSAQSMPAMCSASFGQSRRTADVTAAGEGQMLVLDPDSILELAAEEPRLHARLALAVGRSLADRLGRANREIQVLSR